MFPTFEISDPRFEVDGLRSVTVHSLALGQRADLTIFRPKEAVGRSDVAVVILLHGVYGSHWSWSGQGGAHRTVQRMITERDLPPLVLAMPSDGLWSAGSGYVPHVRQDFERWIVEEVPAVVNQAVPETSLHSPWFLAGLSMGGFGALRLGGKYPQRFRAVAGHSSVTDRAQLRTFTPDNCAEWSDRPEDCSVLAAWQKITGPRPQIRFDCGTDDPLIELNRELHRALTAAGIAHHYQEFPGGHTWPYWEEHLVDTLRFFGETLRSS